MFASSSLKRLSKPVRSWPVPDVSKLGDIRPSEEPFRYENGTCIRPLSGIVFMGVYCVFLILCSLPVMGDLKNPALYLCMFLAFRCVLISFCLTNRSIPFGVWRMV